MLQRRGGSAGQLGGMRSTCPVHAGSPLIAVCQPEKEGSRVGGREESQEKVIRKEEGERGNEEDTERKRERR